jgi:hypothetical protein
VQDAPSPLHPSTGVRVLPQLPALDQRIPGTHIDPRLKAQTRYIGVARVPSGYADDTPLLEKIVTALRRPNDTGPRKAPTTLQ